MLNLSTTRLESKTLADIMPADQAKIPIHKIPAISEGFLNLNTEQQVLFDKMKRTCSDVFSLYGYLPFDVPPFIHRKFLVKGEAEINKQVFSVNRIGTNDMTNYGLAYDRTVPLALWVKEHMKQLSFPFSRHDISLSFRAEHHKTGRLNGFYQADIDTIGINLGLQVDAEAYSTCYRTLKALGLPEFTHYINHIALPKALVREAGFLEERKALNIIDNLDKTPADEIREQLHELDGKVSKEKIKELVDICQFRGSLDEFDSKKLTGEAKEGFESVKFIIERMLDNGVESKAVKFAPGIVRGLEYYTGSLCETFMNDHFRSGSVASGGRYDGLVDDFTKSKSEINGVGISIGLSRIFDVLLHLKVLKPEEKTCAKVAVIFRDKKLETLASQVATQIRERKINTLFYTGNSNGIGKQLDWCNRISVPFAFLVMDNTTFAVKDLQGKVQTEDINSIVNAIDKLAQLIEGKAKSGGDNNNSSKEEKDD